MPVSNYGWWKPLSKTEFERTHVANAKAVADKYNFGEPISPSDEELPELIAKLDQQIDDGSTLPNFYEVMDIKTSLVIRHKGSESIGYPNVTVYDRINSIPPLYRDRFLTAAFAALDIILREKDNLKLKPLVQTYSTHVPIWNRSIGELSWYSRRSTPYRFDSNGYMVQYANIFRYFGSYDKLEPMRKMAVVEPFKEHERFNNLLRLQLRLSSEFTSYEIVIMDELVKLHLEGFKSGTLKQSEIRELVCKRLKNCDNVETIRTHLDNIKRKAIQVFGDEMKDMRAQAIAIFCFQEKLI